MPALGSPTDNSARDIRCAGRRDVAEEIRVAGVTGQQPVPRASAPFVSVQRAMDVAEVRRAGPAEHVSHFLVGRRELPLQAGIAPGFARQAVEIHQRIA